MMRWIVLSFFLIAIGSNVTVVDASPDQEALDHYLEGIHWTELQLEAYLEAEYGHAVGDFETIDELEYFLGDVINATTLQALLDDYQISREELEEILAADGYTLEAFTFIDDIEYILIENSIAGTEPDEFMGFLPLLTEMFELTEEELEALFTYIEAIMIEDVAKLGELDNIFNRLAFIEEFDETSTNISEQQQKEFISVWTELLKLLELEVDFYLDNGESTIPISLEELFKMTEVDKDTSLLVNFYDITGTLLADMRLTGELFHSEFLDQAASIIEKAPVLSEETLADKVDTSMEKEKVTQDTVGSRIAKKEQSEKRTDTSIIEKEKEETGEKLAVTASNAITKLLIGIFVFVLGGILLHYTRLQR